jgi:CBS domain-containing protein
MAAELWEIRDFIAGVPAFAGLPGKALDPLPRRLTVRYVRRGRPFPPEDTGPGLWVLRSGAVIVRDADAALVDKLGEGDLYLDSGPDPGEDARQAEPIEDSLFYFLPRRAFEELVSAHPGFAWRFEQSRAERMRRAMAGLAARRGRADELMAVTVDALLRREPVTGTSGESIRVAAIRMSEERVSALPIVDGDRLVGLVTDRDLRRRCIAAGRSIDAPVAEIMARELVTVAPEASAFEASLRFSRHNVHHLPVVDAAGALLGILSTSDLLRHQGAHAIYLVRDALAAPDVGAVARVGARLPDLQYQLVAMGADAEPLGEAMVTVTDAITRRLLELGERALGPAPVPYAWAALGSQGRREQTAHSDQDHALIMDDAFDPARHAHWFGDLARFVTDGLEAAGLARCPGGTMAASDDWRMPLSGWQRTFRDWIERPEPHALMLATNFFDMRVVAGEPALLEGLWASVRPQAMGNSIFQRLLAGNALTVRMPLGFFRRRVILGEASHDERLDLKHYGLLPIADIARLHALRSGLAERHTVRRLRAAAAAGALSSTTAAELEDAWRLFYVLRARHQAGQIRRGESIDNRLDPAAISGLERDHLRDAFRVVDDHQRWMRCHFDISGTR